jgi:hypothetical protein
MTISLQEIKQLIALIEGIEGSSPAPAGAVVIEMEELPQPGVISGIFALLEKAVEQNDKRLCVLLAGDLTKHIEQEIHHLLARNPDQTVDLNASSLSFLRLVSLKNIISQWLAEQKINSNELFYNDLQQEFFEFNSLILRLKEQVATDEAALPGNTTTFARLNTFINYLHDKFSDLDSIDNITTFKLYFDCLRNLNQVYIKAQVNSQSNLNTLIEFLEKFPEATTLGNTVESLLKAISNIALSAEIIEASAILLLYVKEQLIEIHKEELSYENVHKIINGMMATRSALSDRQLVRSLEVIEKLTYYFQNEQKENLAAVFFGNDDEANYTVNRYITMLFSLPSRDAIIMTYVTHAFTHIISLAEKTHTDETDLAFMLSVNALQLAKAKPTAPAVDISLLFRNLLNTNAALPVSAQATLNTILRIYQKCQNDTARTEIVYPRDPRTTYRILTRISFAITGLLTFAGAFASYYTWNGQEIFTSSTLAVAAVTLLAAVIFGCCTCMSLAPVGRPVQVNLSLAEIRTDFHNAGLAVPAGLEVSGQETLTYQDSQLAKAALTSNLLTSLTHELSTPQASLSNSPNPVSVSTSSKFSWFHRVTSTATPPSSSAPRAVPFENLSSTPS